MSESTLSAVASKSYHRMTVVYATARHVLRPNPKLVLSVMGAALVFGTVAATAYLIMIGEPMNSVSEPSRLIAFAGLYGLDLAAMYTLGKMLRTF